MDYKDFYSNLFREERYSGAKKELGIWYHGTSMKRIPLILSRGLDPNIPQEKRSWSEDPDVGPGNVSKASYSGVYVTQNLMTARSSGWRTAKNDKSTVAIVIMQLQARSLVADEDDLTHWFASVSPQLQGSIYHHIFPYLWEVYGPPDYHKEYHEKGKNDWCDRTVESLFYDFKIADPLFKKQVRKMLYDEGYRAMLTRVVSFLDKKDRSAYWEWRKDYAEIVLKDPRNYGEDVNIPDPPKPVEGEKIFRQFIDKLSRTMKHKARTSFSGKYSKTGRSMDVIGFSGTNKIISIVEVTESKTVKYADDVKIVYGELPEDFKKQWTEHQGPLRIVT